MSYENFLGDQLLGTLGESRIATGSAHLEFAARAHLSVVPDAIDLTTMPGDEDQWQERALCAQTDPEAFFPEKGGSTRDAKKVCGACNVRSQCLEYALSNDERFGIWGGLSERERRRLRKRAI